MICYPIIFGIDVSKDTLDICELTKAGKIFYQIPNNGKAIKKWLQKSETKNALFVFEPTGSYSSHLLHLLSQFSLNFSLVNPNQSNGFCIAQSIISKDDRQAAHTLALMGKSLDLPLSKPICEPMQHRKQLLMGINALKKQKQVLKNQLHALSHQVQYAPQVAQALQKALDTVETQLESLENDLNDLSDEEHDKQFELLTSIKGIGPRTAHLLLNATAGLQNFKHARQLSKFVGIVPFSHKSGSSVHKKGRITKKGDRELRSSLYMAARSAKQYNLACKDLYERLRKIGKPHKQAMVAVMNKLVKQAYGVVRSGISFDNQYYLNFNSN